MERITADFNNLMNQAVSTGNSYFRDAIREVDAQFGEGAHVDNKNLVIALMQAYSADLNNSVSGVMIQNLGMDIQEALAEVARCVMEAGA